MTLPTLATFGVIAENQEISLPPDLMARAVETHATLRPRLEELRAVRLSFLELIEPATVSRWIENGGRSQ